jgi:hypothetical protein
LPPTLVASGVPNDGRRVVGERDHRDDDPGTPRPPAVGALALDDLIGLETVWILDGLEVTIRVHDLLAPD